MLADHHIALFHPVFPAHIDGEGIELVQGVPPDDHTGQQGIVGVFFFQIIGAAEGLVFGLVLVQLHQLLAQLGVVGLELFVFLHNGVQPQKPVHHPRQTVGEQRRHLLDGGEGGGEQLLRGRLQPAVGAGVGHDAGHHHTGHQQGLEPARLEKVLQRGPPFPPPEANTPRRLCVFARV